MNNNKLLIISDFDGTISLQDVNDSIFNNLGDDKSQEIEILFQNEEIGLKEALRRHYKRINITEEEFVNYVKNNIEIDPYFHNFYKRTIDNNIDLIIVSGGFINYIDILFNKIGLDFKKDVLANKLQFTGDSIELSFLHDIVQCHEKFGVCGNCKYKIIREYKTKGYSIIYIGDGLTDRCVAREADFLLVKVDTSLSKYCSNNNINFISFKDFEDVNRIVKDIRDSY